MMSDYEVIRPNYKIGDRVILRDGVGIFTLECNKSYRIVDIKYNYQPFFALKKGIYIVLEGDEEREYNLLRFKKDLSFERRQKIKKMKWKNQN